MRYRVNSGPVISEVIDGEAVIINLTTGNYYSLNESGAAVWSSIEGSAATVDELAAGLTSRYDASAAHAESAVEALIVELEREDLIVASEGNGASAAAPDEEAPSQRAAFEPPRLEKHTDMQDLILLDPVHEVGEQGWPHAKDEAASA